MHTLCAAEIAYPDGNGVVHEGEGRGRVVSPMHLARIEVNGTFEQTWRSA